MLDIYTCQLFITITKYLRKLTHEDKKDCFIHGSGSKKRGLRASNIIVLDSCEGYCVPEDKSTKPVSYIPGKKPR